MVYFACDVSALYQPLWFRHFPRLRLGCGFRLTACQPGYVFLWVIKPLDLVPMVSLEEMRIDIERDTDTTMTKLLLDVFDVGTLLNEETGVGVAAIMEADPSNLCPI
jgi:hypothetical protein